MMALDWSAPKRSKKEPVKPRLDKTVTLARVHRFIVFDTRPGRATYNHAQTVAVIGLDQFGLVGWFAFTSDTSSFEEARHYRALQL